MIPRRKNSTPRPATDGHPAPLDARVLLVSPHAGAREHLAARLCPAVASLAVAESAHQALDAVRSRAFDLALIPAALGARERGDLTGALLRHSPALGVVVFADSPTLDDAVDALRSGACDLIASGLDTPGLLARLAEVLHRRHWARAREDRIARLRDLCRRFNDSRHQATRNIGGLCTDLTSAFADLSDKLTLVSVASEFNSLIRQELDIESLLRTVLEYLLTRTGPTNAAIFLPSSSGDFTLGAYVNYDGPRDSAEILLEHLADALAPRFEDEREIVMLTGRDQIASRVGRASEWLGESVLAAFSCHSDHECLAVVALFRDRNTPFAEALIPTLRTISDLFARQLARVVHVHHRHLPPSKWGDKFDTTRDDEDLPDIDLAA